MSTITVTRLQKLQECLEWMLKQLEQMDPLQHNFLCHRADVFMCEIARDKVAGQDAKNLIMRAIAPHFTLNTWHRETHGEELSRAQMQDMRQRFLKQLIKDCAKEIKRLS